MKIIAGIATFDARLSFLEKAVASLRHQVDEIHVYNNSRNPDLTDNGKFYPLQQLTEPCYFFSCDDDIVYPRDYTAKMIAAIEQHNGQAIVTHHGRKLKGTDRNYYTGHYSYNCMRDVYGSIRIDVAGTGVTAFRTDVFNESNYLEILNSSDRRMSDVVFSLEAAKQQIPIYIQPHMQGYFQDLAVPSQLTCYGMEHKAPIRQGQLADEIYKLNYGR